MTSGFGQCPDCGKMSLVVVKPHITTKFEVDRYLRSSPHFIVILK